MAPNGKHFQPFPQEGNMAMLCHLPSKQTVSTVCTTTLLIFIFKYFNKNTFSYFSKNSIKLNIRCHPRADWPHLIGAAAPSLIGRVGVTAATSWPVALAQTLSKSTTPIDCFKEDIHAYPVILIYLCSFGEYAFFWKTTAVPTDLLILIVDHASSGWQLSWQRLKRNSGF